MSSPTQTAQEFLRALRGSRSQVAFSRRLGFSTNVAYTWECGRRAPSMTQVFRACRLVKIDVHAAVQSFFSPLDWLEGADLESTEAVARLVRELRGDIPVTELAARAGVSRFALSRWLAGTATPKIHDFFGLVHASSGRLPDFVAGFVDPLDLPSVAEAWRSLEARRDVVWRHPWVSAVLQALVLDAYRSLPAHRPGWIADRLGLSASLEAECIAALEAAGAIAWSGTHYRQAAALTVDTRRSAGAGRVLQAHWAEVGLDAIREERPGLFGFNVCCVSSEGLAQMRQMHRAHYRSMRAVAAASESADHVVLLNVQLLELGAP